MSVASSPRASDGRPRRRSGPRPRGRFPAPGWRSWGVWGPGALLAALLAWAPWPFGSVVPEAALALRIAAALALAAAGLLALLASPRADEALRGARGRRSGEAPEPLFARVRGPALAFAALALLGLLQAVTWPLSLVQTVSPEHARLAVRAASVAGLDGGRLEEEGTREAAGAAASEDERAAGSSLAAAPLSLAPEVTRQVAAHWLALLAALGAAAWAAPVRSVRRLLGGAFLATAVFQVLAGARLWLAGATELWGRPLPGTAERLRGTFVNPDHCATYLEVALAVAFAWGWWGLRQARRELAPERKLALAGPPVLVWATLFLGLAFTGSRAGLVAAVAGVVLQGLLATEAHHGSWSRSGSDRGAEDAGRRGLPLWSPRRWVPRRLWWAPAGAITALLGLGVVAAVSFEAGFGRLAASSTYDLAWAARPEVYRRTLELIGRFPFLGSGAGTYREAFPLVQSADLGGVWWHAHSGPLELLATVGILGTGLFLVGLALVLRRLGRVLRRGRRSEDRAVALAALGALASVGLHELVDFGLTMPATAFTLAILLGAACGARTLEDR